jgi:hypothetical protein
MLVLIELVECLRELRGRICLSIHHENALKPVPLKGYGVL